MARSLFVKPGINLPSTSSRPQYTDFSSTLGYGLGAGLKSLVEDKLGQLAQRQQEDAWVQAGFPSNIAKLMVSVKDPKTQQSLLDRMEGLSLGQQGQAPINQPFTGQRQPFIDQGFPDQQQEQPFADERLPEQVSPGQESFAQEFPQLAQQKGITLGASPAERRHRENLEEKRRATEQKSKDIRSADLKKDYVEASNKLFDTEERLGVLDRMMELGKEPGGLGHPLIASSLQKMDLLWLLNPEAEEYAGLQKEFLKDLRPTFGGRITEEQMKQFMLSIPRLNNSPEGRERIAKNLRIIYDAKKLRSQVLMDTIKKHKDDKDMTSLDISIMATEKLRSKQKKLSNRFKSDLKKEIPVVKTVSSTDLGAAEGRSARHPDTGEEGKIINKKFVPGRVINGKFVPKEVE